MHIFPAVFPSLTLTHLTKSSGVMFGYGHMSRASQRRKETLISGVLLRITCSEAETFCNRLVFHYGSSRRSYGLAGVFLSYSCLSISIFFLYPFLFVFTLSVQHFNTKNTPTYFRPLTPSGCHTRHRV